MTQELKMEYLLLIAMIEHGITPNSSTSTLERKLYYGLIESIIHNTSSIIVDRANILSPSSNSSAVDTANKCNITGNTQ